MKIKNKVFRVLKKAKPIDRTVIIKKTAELVAPKSCKNCGKKVKIGERLYFIYDALLCEKCMNESKAIFKKQGYDVVIK